MRREIDWTLYLVTDRGLCGSRTIDDVVLAAVKGGVTVVQLREKNCSTREFIELARRFKSALSALKIPLIINDRVDIALACEADGVHIGPTDMKIKDVRRLLGKNSIIGVSVETFADAHIASSSDVDYLGVSPIFETPTKTDVHGTWGLSGLRQLRKECHKPLIAIGGINISNAFEVMNAGADGIAVVSAICGSQDPEQAARALRDRLTGATTAKRRSAR